MMKRLLLVLGVLGASLSLAQFEQKTTFYFQFPKYAAVFSNVSEVYFFDDSQTLDGAGALQNASGYFKADEAGLLKCITDTTKLPNDYTINGSEVSANLYCKFYPNAIDKDNGFNVNGYASAASPDTDGELLIITNSSNFNVAATVDSNSNSNLPNDIKIYAFPGYLKNDGTVAGAGSTTPSAQEVRSFSADQNSAFSTQYSFAKVIPLLFYAEVDVLNTDPSSTNSKLIITWEGWAQ